VTKLTDIWHTIFRHKITRLVVWFLAIGGSLFLLVPKPDLYEKYSFSSAVYDRNGKLLNLTLSMDEKYRLFTPLKDIPQEARQALLLYEDRYFYVHPGVNPLRMAHAIYEMLRGGRRQGASTVTMQLARLIYQIDSSSLSGKFEQILRALQIELFYRKDEILEAYFNLAPYGGNIEGLGAAARIYFNKKSKDLSLPEIMALTVIPQNPGKRNLLTVNARQETTAAAARLQKIWRENYDHEENTYLDLPLSSGVHLPKEAPHFVRRILKNDRGEINATLDLNYQHSAEEILQAFVREHHNQGIFNASAIIIDARNMDVLAYIGSSDFNNNTIFGQVDGTRALRSPGSALKPFIYAMALEKGLIHPLSMLKDVPRNYGVYTPENFDHSFYGLVNATQALVYSRNIPAVDLLLKIGENEFYTFLQNCNVRRLKPMGFYGLSMALGGTEVSLQDLAAMYAMLFAGGKFRPLRFKTDENVQSKDLLSPEAAFLTRYMLSQNQAVDENLTPFSLQKQKYSVAWKTGTSYGYKDAWSIGIVGPYVIAVWVGNFDGTPNHAFVGREAAAPLFFRLVRKFAGQNPASAKVMNADQSLNLAKVEICRDTGDIANAYCNQRIVSYFIPGVTTIRMSDVSRLIPIDVKSGLRACRHQPPQTEMRRFNFWSSDVLKAFAEAGISIGRPPAFKENCSEIEAFNTGRAPQIVTPADGGRFVLQSHKLANEKIALKAVLDADAENVYWFLNNRLVGNTKAGEVLEVMPAVGSNEIKAVDDMGRVSVVKIKTILTD